MRSIRRTGGCRPLVLVRPGGFTLVELLVVIGILLLLTFLTVGAMRATTGDRIKGGGRTAQAAILGARDRALHAKDRRGIRLVRDPLDTSLVNGLVYLQPIPTQTYDAQTIQLERPDWNSDNDVADAGEQDVIIVRGFDPPDPTPHTDWHTLRDFFSRPGKIRIPSGTGAWYTFAVNATGPYALNASNQYLVLTTPLVDSGVPGQVAHPRSSTWSSCDIEMSPEVLPNHSMIALPSSIVIDLDNSSDNVRSYWAANTDSIDIMFSPRGTVSGPLSALGPLHFLLNDIQDATQNLDPADLRNKGEKLVLTVFPQTGHVATFQIDPTDNVDNGTGNPGSDGKADHPFRFAQLGAAQ